MEHFLKVDGIIAAQTPKIEPAFNSILNDFSTIIEIGFHRGALSLWLNRNKTSKTKLVCYDITFEHKEINDNTIDFRQGDCFDQKIIDEIQTLIQGPGKTLLLCDGGHKEKEFELYATFLKQGDVIMCHDYAHNEADYAVIKESLGWQTAAESNYVNIVQAVNKNNLEPYNYDLFKNILWGSFIKKPIKTKLNDLAVVICYCSNDHRFIEKCLDQALLISDNVIVPISDHLFGGDPEDIESIKILTHKYPQVNFSIFKWHPGKHPRYWHNMSRILGNSLISDEYRWVLFLDADEILEADLFNKFVNSDTFESYDTYKLGCYWYFREPIYQSKSFECSPVLIRKHLTNNINPNDISCEREQMFEYLNVPKQFLVLQDDKPMIHHFSWVRTKEEMLNKIKNWGHANDTDWKTLVEEEFSRPFNGTDFIHNYEYTIVENKYNI